MDWQRIPGHLWQLVIGLATGYELTNYYFEQGQNWDVLHVAVELAILIAGLAINIFGGLGLTVLIYYLTGEFDEE